MTVSGSASYRPNCKRNPHLERGRDQVFALRAVPAFLWLNSRARNHPTSKKTMWEKWALVAPGAERGQHLPRPAPSSPSSWPTGICPFFPSCGSRSTGIFPFPSLGSRSTRICPFFPFPGPLSRRLCPFQAGLDCSPSALPSTALCSGYCWCSF